MEKTRDIEEELLSAELLWKKTQALQEDLDKSLFEGKPVDKWKDILFNADVDLVKEELERLLDILALQEEVIEKYSLGEAMEKIALDTEAYDKIQRHKDNFAIESMSKILGHE